MSETASFQRAAGSMRGRAVEGTTARKVEPVVYWAAIGALLSAYMAYIAFAWITGPNFMPVDPGPTAQAEWLTNAQIAFQATLFIATLILGYKMIVTPWLRERRLTTDGALFIAFLTMFFQDQFSNAGGYWFTYNAHVLNFGSWFPELFFWQTFAQPGATAPEPVFMMATGYIYFFVASMFLGLFIMRRMKAMWPSISAAMMFTGVFVGMALVDVIIEVFIWLPLGFYAYTWAPGPMINAGTAHQFPIIEAIAVGVLSTAIVALRYYTDDKGNTIVERGIDKVTSSPRKRAALRLFALIAAIQVIFLVVYNFPMYQIGAHSKDWPVAIQERSYLLDNICGGETDRACPTADTPLVLNSPTAIRVTPDGELIVPEGAAKPKRVPFVAGP